MNHKHFLKLAKKCSQNSTYSIHKRVQIGCLLVYKGTILAKGWNTERTHTRQMHYNSLRFSAINHYPSKLHAEINVLNKVKYLDIDFSKAILYIYREYNDGSPAMARCCPSCFAAAKAMGIGTIVYTTENGYAIEKISN